MKLLRLEFIRITIIAPALLLALLFVLLPNKSYGASFRVEPNRGDYKTNQEVPVRIVLNTEQQVINTVEAQIVIPSGVNAKISDGNSIISHWIESPAVINNLVKFSGIIANGYQGSNGTLVTLLLSSNINQVVSINFGSLPKALINDGQGTFDKVSVLSGQIRFNSSGDAVEGEVDVVPPEPFTVNIISDQNIQGGQYVAIFNTQDKGSGIDHYEVLEQYGRSYGDEERWQAVTSPYVLRDQTRNSYIFIKAVDRAGNIRIASVAPAPESGFLQRVIKPLVLTIFLLLIITILRMISSYRLGNLALKPAGRRS